MKALSIKQPWAWLICKGFKTIENRDWTTAFRGRFYVHAGKVSEATNKEVLGAILKALSNRQASEFMLALGHRKYPEFPAPDNLILGAIIGEVDIVGCVTESASLWFVGPIGFILANPVLYEQPIPCRGKLEFFEPDLTKAQEFALKNCLGGK